MLKSLDPILNPDLLFVLASMGHGDDIVLVDANFPADSVAQDTVHGEPVVIAAETVDRALAAILTLMPLDTFVEAPAWTMEVVGKPGEVPPAVRDIQAALDAGEGRAVTIAPLERFAFYEAARKAYAIVVTGERRFYGNVILRKGVIPPEA